MKKGKVVTTTSSILLLLISCWCNSRNVYVTAFSSRFPPFQHASRLASVWRLSTSSSPLTSKSTTPPASPASPASPAPPVPAPPLTYSSSSPASLWHRRRRQAMMEKYRDQIAPLEKSSSQNLGLLLLGVANGSLMALSLWAGSLPSVWSVVLLAIFPGSIFSLWQLQLLHDVLHGCFFPEMNSNNASLLSPKTKKEKQAWQDLLLFWGSMPSIFGYYLYLKFGHLTHHKNFGNPDMSGNLKTLFDSHQESFEDGDVLFVAHRMKLLGSGGNVDKAISASAEPPDGPTFRIPNSNRTVTWSLSRSAFSLWQPDKPYWNGLVFATSFLLERFLLAVNDVVVAVTGRNAFFPNKPASFHRQCAQYARCAIAVRFLLWYGSGCSWNSLLFLYLSEALWGLPPHPAAAMFVTNHPSFTGDSDDSSTSSSSLMSSSCIPTRSTYSGRWYSILTLGTNYHCEHHDFPTIPFHQLYRLRQIAPEFYPNHASTNASSLWDIMREALAHPTFYACMGTMDQSLQEQQEEHEAVKK